MGTYLPHLVSIKMCWSINDISKCGGEYNIPQKVEKVLGLICSISQSSVCVNWEIEIKHLEASDLPIHIHALGNI